MVGKHGLQKPPSIIGLPASRRVCPKTDEIMGNSGTATAVPAATGAAPLRCAYFFYKFLILQTFLLSSFTRNYLVKGGLESEKKTRT